jgi:hypothetical protein
MMARIGLHSVSHTIETMGHPIFTKAQRLDPQKLCIAKVDILLWRLMALCAMLALCAIPISPWSYVGIVNLKFN